MTLGCLLSQSHNIIGKILDSKTKKPIINANVYIENFDFGTVTDKDGFFSLNLNNQLENRIVLYIKMIGYKDETIYLDLSQPKIQLGKIYLITKSLELESIHIHSKKEESKQISDFSLSGQNLNDNLIGNIATTLSNQPNIGVNSFGTVTSKPVLRGFSGDRFLLTKDGNKTGDLSQSSIDHVITLDMTEVSRIEIVRGPKSLIYGSNAIGGVINTTIIGNPKVRTDKVLRKIFFGGESFNKGIYGNIGLYVPVKNSQINILLSNRKTGNQTSPIGELENTYSQTSNYKLGLTKYNKKSYINFIIENFNMDYGIPPNLGHGVDIELIKNTFQANFHKDISFDNFDQLDIKYNFIDYEHQEFSNNINEVTLSKNTHNFKIELKSFKSIIGFELNYKQFFPSGKFYTPDANELNSSLYGFYKKDFNNFDLLSSFRIGYLLVKPKFDNISSEDWDEQWENIDILEVKDRSFNSISSSIGISKTIDVFEFNTWVMNTMRGPKIEELYSNGPHLGSYSYEIGEPNLKLEKIYGIESSISYTVLPLSFSLSTFYNHSPYYYQMSKIGDCQGVTEEDLQECLENGFIEYGVGPDGWLYIYKTKGVEALIKGLEFNLNYKYDNLQITYDYSLVRGDNLTNELPLSYINPDKQVLVFEYEKELLNYKLRLSNIHSQNRLGEFETYTPSSFLVDFIVSYNRKRQNITAQFNNILDEEYYNHLSKIKFITPEAGRNFTLIYKIIF